MCSMVKSDLTAILNNKVVAGCRNALVGTGWFNSCLVCTNRLRKHCSHLVGSSFLAVKGFSALNRCLLAENAD